MSAAFVRLKPQNNARLKGLSKLWDSMRIRQFTSRVVRSQPAINTDAQWINGLIRRNFWVEDGEYETHMVQICRQDLESTSANRAPAILMLHGAIENHRIFVSDNKAQGIAPFLAHRGYNVFLTYQHHQHQRHVLLEHQRSSPCAPTSACAGTRGCSSGQLCICCSAQTILPFLRPWRTPHITLHCPSPWNLSASGLRQRSPDGPSPLAKCLLPQIQRGLLIQPYRHRGPARGCWCSKEPLQQ